MPDLPEYLAADRLYGAGTAGGSSLRNGAVIAMAQAARIVVQFGTVLLLARLLTPDAFGTVALVMAAVALFELFRDLYFSSAAVRRPGITQQELSNLYWCTVGVSVAGFLAIWAGVNILPANSAVPELGALIVCLSAGTLLSGLAVQHGALLRRQTRFAALAVIEIAAAALGASAAVVAALMDAGIWALVIQRLVMAWCLAILSIGMCRWRPSPPRRNVPVRHLLGFGGRGTLPAVLGFTGRNLDHLLIGWWWGITALGLYERANRLFTTSVQNANVPLLAFSLPLLRRLESDPVQFRHAYLRIMQALCMLTMPMAAILIAAPDWIVSLLFGHSWLDAVPIVMWIGVLLLGLPALNAATWLFDGGGRTDEMARWSIADFVLRMLAVIGGLRFGVDGVVAALAFATLSIRIPLAFWAVGRRGPVTPLDLFGALIPAAVAASVVVGTVIAARRVPAFMNADAFTGLSMAFSLAAIVTLAGFLCLPRGRQLLRELRAVRALLVRQEARP